MIIRTKSDVENNEFYVHWGNGTSYRFLTESDGMGYTLTETFVNPESCSVLEYQNHLEACYCIEGDGKVVDEKTGEEHIISAGTIYALDKHDKHQLIGGKNGMRLVCMFTPALNGRETHKLNADGSSSY